MPEASHHLSSNFWSRRTFLATSGLGIAAAATSRLRAQSKADFSIDIARTRWELAPKHFIDTIAYNNQVPGPLLRMREGQSVTVDVQNRTGNEEVVHWHGLYLPPAVDGAMEEGTPMLVPGGHARYTFTPQPAGLRWYHTHTFAGDDLKKGQYTGQHGPLFIEARDNPGAYDAEFFLTLHDWNGHLMSSDDGAMNPLYDTSTINGRVLGFNEPLRVRRGQRVLFHIVNVSATEPHWLALPGHTFQVIALDGNTVPVSKAISLLHLAPAERISAIVTMDQPGRWILGEARKHIQAAGMGIVVEYADASGAPQWQQPDTLEWRYLDFANPGPPPQPAEDIVEIPLVFQSKFKGHGSMEDWTINGKSFPDTTAPALQQGKRYRLKLINRSLDDHPVHLHRHSFEVRRLDDKEAHGLIKDVILVPANKSAEVEFTANHPGDTLFHCHQQNHMDRGFMLLFHYA